MLLFLLIVLLMFFGRVDLASFVRVALFLPCVLRVRLARIVHLSVFCILLALFLRCYYFFLTKLMCSICACSHVDV